MIHQMTEFPPGEVRVWWASPDKINDPALLERQLGVLSESERARQSRFVFERGRREFLVSHALVRDALSRCAPVAPSAWLFAENEYGRPHIVEPAEFGDLRFSLSHTAGRAVVAVTRGLEIGADVENVRRGYPVDIAERFFAPSEVAQLAVHVDAFFDFWTLKEAYMKARGLGFAIPLSSFAFDLSDPARPAITFHNGCEDEPSRWRFLLDRSSPDYRFALAVSSGDQPISVVQCEIVPVAD